MEVTTEFDQIVYSTLSELLQQIVNHVNDKYDLSSTVDELIPLQCISTRTSALPTLKPRTNTRKSPKTDTPVKICEAIITKKDGTQTPCTFKARPNSDYCGKHPNFNLKAKATEAAREPTPSNEDDEVTQHFSVRRHNSEVNVIEGVPIFKKIAVDSNSDTNLVRGHIDDSGDLIPSVTELQKQELIRSGFVIGNDVTVTSTKPKPPVGVTIKAQLKPKAPIKITQEEEQEDFWPETETNPEPEQEDEE